MVGTTYFISGCNVIFRSCLLVKVGQEIYNCPYYWGFLTAPKGSVTIDGLDICDIDIEWWRQTKITYVSQHPHIGERHLARGFYPLDVEACTEIRCCKEVQLPLIRSLAVILDAVIGEGGLGLKWWRTSGLP